jgi:hypothetical protein
VLVQAPGPALRPDSLDFSTGSANRRSARRLRSRSWCAPVYPESRLEDTVLKPVRAALEQIMRGHLPYPAVIAQPYGELVAANSAFEVLTHGVAPELLQAPVNVLRLAVHPKGMAPRVENLSQWGQHIVENALELKINFLRPVWHTRLSATASVVQRGRTVGLIECDVSDAEGRLVARASSTCLTLRGARAQGR